MNIKSPSARGVTISPGVYEVEGGAALEWREDGAVTLSMHDGAGGSVTMSPMTPGQLVDWARKFLALHNLGLAR